MLHQNAELRQRLHLRPRYEHKQCIRHLFQVGTELPMLRQFDALMFCLDVLDDRFDALALQRLDILLFSQPSNDKELVKLIDSLVEFYLGDDFPQMGRVNELLST